MAEILRAVKHRVVLAANKADELPHVYTHHAFHELGIGEPLPVSAATGKGSGDLLDRIAELLSSEGDETGEETIDVAVVGRPNVGKSSLVNRLVGAERSIVTPQPGTTRDAIDSPLRYHGQTLNFIDTAGLRRRPKVKDVDYVDIDPAVPELARELMFFEDNDRSAVHVDDGRGLRRARRSICRPIQSGIFDWPGRRGSVRFIGHRVSFSVANSRR